MHILPTVEDEEDEYDGKSDGDSDEPAPDPAYINLITWNKAYSIFARQTLINHQFFPLRSLGDDFGSNLNELSNQEWTTRNLVWADFAGAEVRKIEGLRRVGDRSTLVILLDTDSVQARLLASPVTRYSYTAASTQ
ncbi:hypothetical protein NKR23_g11892 [Pleurostoma richardsiae]|uniref:Uncharacterized protein n=1 Tax=Pleurostoma richardsiae TaxID=41990 RepID=A0AA38VGB3_9PEZI|nr:hypothetical protein NKR23_g11892 [Pleurostoma richardsiae]